MKSKTSDRKKEDIVRAAFSVFMDGGIPAISYHSISRKSGISRQLVRYHFKDVETLMVSLCDHLAAVYRSLLVDGVLKASGHKRLDFFLDFYFDLLDEHPKPRDDQVYDAMFSMAAGSAKIRKNLSTQYGLLGHVVSHEMQLQYPELKAEHCSELSYLFVCLMYGHWKMVASLGFSEDHKFITRQAMVRLIDSYREDKLEPMRFIKTWSLEA